MRTCERPEDEENNTRYFGESLAPNGCRMGAHRSSTREWADATPKQTHGCESGRYDEEVPQGHHDMHHIALGPFINPPHRAG